MLGDALKLADDGYRVFPLAWIEGGYCSCRMKCASPGKHPLIDSWDKKATTDPDDIERWWTKWPNANIGIATGEASDLWVIDIDNKGSIEVGPSLVGLGDHSLRELEGRHGHLPESSVVQTGGGGSHLYFGYPRDGRKHGNRTRILPGIDVRGEGGYVVAPPSIHVSGHVYRWSNRHPRPVQPPAWLVELAAVSDATGEDVARLESFPEGSRNESLHKVGAKYRRDYGFEDWQLYPLLMAHNVRQCHPPLDQEEVRRIVANVAKYDYVPKIDLSLWEGEGDAPPIPEGGDLAMSLSDFIANRPEQPETLVDGLIHGGTGVVIGGQANLGKTWLAMDLALAIGSGGEWLRKFGTDPGDVLVIDEEGHPYGDWERFSMLLNGRDWMSPSIPKLHLAIGSGIRLDTEVGVARIRRMLERYKPKLVIADALVRFHSGDENDSRSMANFFAVTKDLMRYYGTTFLFTHHVRKPSLESNDPGDLLRGSTEIRAWPDTIFVLMPGDDSTEVVVHHVKARWGKRMEPFKARIVVDEDDQTCKIGWIGEIEREDRTSVGQHSLILRAIADFNGIATAEDIAAKTGKSLSTVRSHLKVMVAGGAIETANVAQFGKKVSTAYRLTGVPTQ